jgi:CubicO group peptidase (beta-lactamase class C family)
LFPKPGRETVAFWGALVVSMRSYYVASVAFIIAIFPPWAAAQNPWPTQGWPASTPAAVGLDPASLAAFDAELASGKYGYVDSMLVIRNGQVVYDRSYTHDYDRIYGRRATTSGPLNVDPAGPYNYFNPDWHPYYRRGDLHTLQSVTKSVASAVIGIAMARSEFPELDTPVLRFFDTAKLANLDDRKRRISLRHLLTMTAGLDWNEDVPYYDPQNTASQMEARTDWVRFVIDRPMAHEPGTVFAYNSGASQLLSHVFRKATGTDIDTYAATHLFKPLGIRHSYWKRTPTGLADTEGGLYLRPRDLAKIGYLFLRNGVWDGQPILRAEWVKTSVAEARRGSEYGFQWWLVRYGSPPDGLAWAGNGFGGQRLIVVPEHDLVLVFTGWTILSPSLTSRQALEGVLRAVVQQHRGDFPRRHLRPRR